MAAKGKIYVVAALMAGWLLLGYVWLDNYFSGGEELKRLVIHETAVLLGVASCIATLCNTWAHTVSGCILLAAAAFSAVPTVRAIRAFGFDAGGILPLLCSVAILACGIGELAKGRRQKEKEKQR